MSSDLPSAPGVEGVRARYSTASRSSIGCVRFSVQPGKGSTRRRSTSRTRMRNEDEHAPITIDALSAVERGTALEQDALDLEP